MQGNWLGSTVGTTLSPLCGLLRQLGVKSVHFPVEEGPQGLVPAVEEAMIAVMSEPYGSVVVILDEDVLNTIVDIAPAQVATPPLKGTSNSATPMVDTQAAIVQAAELLVNKQRPVLVLNQEVGRSPGARKAAEKLASLTGAHVLSPAMHRAPFSTAAIHPVCGNLSFGQFGRRCEAEPPAMPPTRGGRGPFPQQRLAQWAFGGTGRSPRHRHLTLMLTGPGATSSPRSSFAPTSGSH